MSEHNDPRENPHIHPSYRAYLDMLDAAFPKQCTACGETIHYYDDGNGSTQALCGCKAEPTPESETRILAYQSIFDPNSPVRVTVQTSDVEQFFLDQCRLAWHSHAETTIKINGATKECEINTKMLRRKFGGVAEPWRSKVKRVPELPDCYTDVLLWHSGRWNKAWYDGSWVINEMPYNLEDGQYWLPLPTFNPEE